MRCLLVTDVSSANTRLQQVMDDLDVEVVKIDRLHIDWLTETTSSPVDFMCVVLPPRGPKADDEAEAEAEAATFVDIGVALGRRIPVFLVVEPYRKVPLVLAGLTRVEADLNNADALTLHLGQFLRAIERNASRPPKKHTQRPALSPEEAAKAHEDLRALGQNIGSMPSGLAFEQLMIGILNRPESDISSPPVGRDGGWDLALWAQDTDFTLDSPILVQLKLWFTSPNHGLARAADELARQLKKQPAPFGLLIYHVIDEGQPGPSPASDQARSPIVTVSAHEFVDMMAEQPLSSLLISMRNAVAHGVPYRA
ncbi:hypothetical protein [Mycobacterium stomatepiae]|uniref:Restriction endonuclease type IV Mrr domain-containing protein n=1 Tax=Mycobacterium stomatepiae TaxID=470076 RepID=A0A7I7QDE1_9MYCO|nr:hypothetical protein [Mycobacterium stomatepiae]MCV7164994.1 hypothetical protein [Mycobacterium stomatepiae]BBY24132.1 hypothetical protein MSTO_43370 [Mycobacterium stomatepiae]